MKMVDVAITVEKDRLPDETMVSAVKDAGFTIDRVFPSIGAIYGHGPASCMTILSAIDGVARIREAETYQLPPLRSGIAQ